MKPPCKDCKDRHVGCHGACERYKQYKTELEAAKAEIYGEPEQKLMLREMELKRVSRILRRQHQKGSAK